MKKIHSFLVAGTHSGVGKTTVTLALLSLLAKRGYRVQPFKHGPDFIDSGYHRLATGRDSINLDPWMMGWKGVSESFREHSAGADLSVIEGMGALYDGEKGTLPGSSAEVSRRLRVPVLLVLDIWGMTATTDAILQGLLGYDPSVRIAGILLNRAGSEAHYRMVLHSLRSSFRRKVIGYLPHSRAYEVPERHLGLRTVQENQDARRMKIALVRTASRTIDLSKWIRLLGPGFKAKTSPRSFAFPKPKVRLGVAKDKAFCFYYAENLQMLHRAGARLVPFSPLRDRRLPKDLDGLYFGGGYPESFPDRLSANRTMKRDILACIREGMPVYAECGGLMYLSKSLAGFEGLAYPMVSALPLRIKMDRDHLTIRHAEIRTKEGTLLGPAGTVARGQEFHQSRIVHGGLSGTVYEGRTSFGKRFREGFRVQNLLASYIHLHFQSNPSVPSAFVEKCMAYREARRGSPQKNVRR